MTFKEKHFRQAFGPLMFSALMLLPTSCGRIFKGYSPDEQSGGLLDPTPVEVKDYYGTEVALSQVDIPVYDENGNRLQNRWVLTRGLPDTRYQASTSMYDLRRVRLNGSDEECYVRVDKNNAILTAKGGCGLFENYGNVIVISDANLDKYLNGRQEKILKNTAKLSKKVEAKQAEKTVETSEPQPTDSIVSDTIVNAPDTLNNAVVNKVVADTLQHNL